MTFFGGEKVEKKKNKIKAGLFRHLASRNPGSARSGFSVMEAADNL